MVTPQVQLDDLVTILRCPLCDGGAELELIEKRLRCPICGSLFPVERGVPLMVARPLDVRVMPMNHESNQVDDSVLDWLETFPGWTLNLGAGSSERRPSRCIEVEYALFRNTCVVGDAHRLPFKDGTFDAAISYNTFEHLGEPSTAASELLRVLKPGAELRLQTAFLQPLHEEPAHYYGATEFGLRRWFGAFDINDCFVPDNMNPVYALGWICSSALWWVGIEFGAQARRVVGDTTLDDWETFWTRRFEDHSEKSAASYLQNLSQTAQKHLAFGNELHATSPGDVALSSPAPADLMEMLRCPSCNTERSLDRVSGGVICRACARDFREINGVPVLLKEERDVRVMPPDHESNPVGEEVLRWLDSLPGWSLNLGAGASIRRPSRCIELEYAVFRNTSIVADAHHLPFVDGAFEVVVSYNTFEHLADPSRAAAELRRILKPGGKLRIQTAFLQPLHEEPAHFYNATEYGLRRWFSEFEIDDCFVPPEMGPAHTLAWLSNHVLYDAYDALGPEMWKMTGSLKLSQFARFWEVPSTRHGFLKTLFELMPDRMPHFSAGFEIRARRPSAGEPRTQLQA